MTPIPGKAPLKANGGFLAPFSRPGFVAGMAVATIAAVAVLNRLPGIDLVVTSWFFSPEACAPGKTALGVCGGFPLRGYPFLAQVRQFFHVLPVVVAVCLLVMLVVRKYGPQKLETGFDWGAAVAVSSFALCSGVLVNLVLKIIWGRPRPYSTDLFGGGLPFVPAGRISDACVKDCSFVSGEAAGAFWLVCLVPLAPAHLRAPLYVAALAIALFTSGLRIAFGAHYLSDVVVGALLSVLFFSIMALIASRALMSRGVFSKS